jgi:hypothetical protein
VLKILKSIILEVFAWQPNRRNKQLLKTQTFRKHSIIEVYDAFPNEMQLRKHQKGTL